MAKDKIISAVLQTAKELELDALTIREIAALNLPEIKPLPPNKIKKMRLQGKLSQAVMAKILNVAISTYQKWERGEVVPKGGNLKLLHLAYDNGISYLIV